MALPEHCRSSVWSHVYTCPHLCNATILRAGFVFNFLFDITDSALFCSNSVTSIHTDNVHPQFSSTAMWISTSFSLSLREFVTIYSLAIQSVFFTFSHHACLFSFPVPTFFTSLCNMLVHTFAFEKMIFWTARTLCFSWMKILRYGLGKIVRQTAVLIGAIRSFWKW